MEATTAAVETTAPTAMETSSTAMEATTTTAAMATGRERRLRQTDQDNRCNRNTKTSRQIGFFHINSSAPPHI
jgi:hypothetical protein